MRPTRLLDVTVTEEDGQPGLHLFETTPGRSYEYVCLSHRWDDEVDSHKTTTQNLVEVMKSINLANLPGNFRDAVAITRELGIQYLWIDSLCIVQEGDNGQDLGREIAKIGFMYQNAQLTIAAVSSPNSSLGYFMNDRWPNICLQMSQYSKRSCYSTV
ncbi:hypothetical protein BU25DRAFT_164981 [Macroventuria anomochaeta]|uniref:Uncharacterized protein n=1 Tax=Macroventuria anomochaeta TaxID=301207 RepID=A0ACB6RQG5_9PLEO|nr:uncharacterized protein BU25DRAFT_164981 [Macroventuria anomochaeta]KAF2623957.1 hypothetical protein BU25DRAFT_164981 [Macroventuria anomochaeta]